MERTTVMKINLIENVCITEQKDRDLEIFKCKEYINFKISNFRYFKELFIRTETTPLYL